MHLSSAAEAPLSLGSIWTQKMIQNANDTESLGYLQACPANLHPAGVHRWRAWGQVLCLRPFSVYSTCWMETGRQAEQCYHKIHYSCRHNRLGSHKGWKDLSEHHDETGIELKYPLKLLGFFLGFFEYWKGLKRESIFLAYQLLFFGKG